MSGSDPHSPPQLARIATKKRIMEASEQLQLDMVTVRSQLMHLLHNNHNENHVASREQPRPLQHNHLAVPPQQPLTLLRHQAAASLRHNHPTSLTNNHAAALYPDPLQYPTDQPRRRSSGRPALGISGMQECHRRHQLKMTDARRHHHEVASPYKRPSRSRMPSTHATPSTPSQLSLQVKNTVQSYLGGDEAVAFTPFPVNTRRRAAIEATPRAPAPSRRQKSHFTKGNVNKWLEDSSCLTFQEKSVDVSVFHTDSIVHTTPKKPVSSDPSPALHDISSISALSKSFTCREQMSCNESQLVPGSGTNFHSTFNYPLHSTLNKVDHDSLNLSDVIIVAETVTTECAVKKTKASEPAHITISSTESSCSCSECDSATTAPDVTRNPPPVQETPLKKPVAAAAPAPAYLVLPSDQWVPQLEDTDIVDVDDQTIHHSSLDTLRGSSPDFCDVTGVCDQTTLIHKANGLRQFLCATPLQNPRRKSSATRASVKRSLHRLPPDGSEDFKTPKVGHRLSSVEATPRTISKRSRPSSVTSNEDRLFSKKQRRSYNEGDKENSGPIEAHSLITPHHPQKSRHSIPATPAPYREQDSILSQHPGCFGLLKASSKKRRPAAAADKLTPSRSSSYDQHKKKLLAHRLKEFQRSMSREGQIDLSQVTVLARM